MNNTKFESKISLREDEEIIHVIHHHPITYWKQILISIGLILGAFFLMFFLVSQGPIGVAFFTAMLVTGIVYGAREFYLWYANVFVITNQRIIDIDQKALFNKTVSEASFDKIIDICYSVKGMKQTIFRLGTIRITAQGLKLVIKNVSQAAEINLLLTDLIREQTGKKIEVKKINKMGEKTKDKLAQEFLEQDEIEEDFEEYKLEELIEEYKDTFGELSLKKLLVEELEEEDDDEDQTSPPEADDSGQEEGADEEDDQEDLEGVRDNEEKPKFKKKSITKRKVA